MIPDRWEIYVEQGHLRRAEEECGKLGMNHWTIARIQEKDRIRDRIVKGNLSKGIIGVLDLRTSASATPESQYIEYLKKELKEQGNQQNPNKHKWNVAENQRVQPGATSFYNYLIVNMQKKEAIAGSGSDIQNLKQVIQTASTSKAQSPRKSTEFNVLLANPSQVQLISSLSAKPDQQQPLQCCPKLNLLDVEPECGEQQSLLPDPSQFPTLSSSRLIQKPEERDYDPLQLEKQTIAAAKLVKKNKEIMDLKRAIKDMSEELASLRSENMRLIEIVESAKLEKQNDREDNGEEVIRKKRKIDDSDDLRRQLAVSQGKCRRLEVYRSRTENLQSIVELERKNVALEDEINIAKYSDVKF